MQPENAARQVGYTDAPSFSVTAETTGVVNDITYQWYKLNGTDMVVIDGANKSTYVEEVSLPEGKYRYQCIVSCDGYDLKSNIVYFNVCNFLVTTDKEIYEYGEKINLKAEALGDYKSQVTKVIITEPIDGSISFTNGVGNTQLDSGECVDNNYQEGGDVTITVEFIGEGDVTLGTSAITVTVKPCDHARGLADDDHYCKYCPTDMSIVEYTKGDSHLCFAHIQKALETAVGQTGTLTLKTSEVSDNKSFDFTSEVPEGSDFLYEVKEGTGLTVNIPEGFELRCDKTIFKVSGGTLTITGGGKMISGSSCIQVERGTLNINGCELSSTGSAPVISLPGGTANITNGAVTPHVGADVTGGTLNITGGTVTGTENGITMNGGKINISGGKLVCGDIENNDSLNPEENADGTGILATGGEIYISNGTIESPTGLNITNTKLTIEDGEVVCAPIINSNDEGYGEYSACGKALIIHGGVTNISGGNMYAQYALRYYPTETSQLILSGGSFNGPNGSGNKVLWISDENAKVTDLLADDCCYYNCKGDIVYKPSYSNSSNHNFLEEKVEVKPAPVRITKQPEDITVEYGEQATISLETEIVNSGYNIQYIWYIDGENKSDIVNNYPEFTLPLSLSEGEHTAYCVIMVENSDIAIATSETAIITVKSCPHTELEVGETSATCKQCKANAVAMMTIGEEDTYYFTIESAFEAANNAEKGKAVEITLFEDVEIDESSTLTVAEGTNLTLKGIVKEMGDYTVIAKNVESNTTADTPPLVKVYGNLTIDSCFLQVTVYVTAYDVTVNCVEVYSGGTLNVKGESQLISMGGTALYAKEGSSVNIYGGYFYGFSALIIDGTAYKNVKLYGGNFRNSSGCTISLGSGTLKDILVEGYSYYLENDWMKDAEMNTDRINGIVTVAVKEVKIEVSTDKGTYVNGDEITVTVDVGNVLGTVELYDANRFIDEYTGEPISLGKSSTKNEEGKYTFTIQSSQLVSVPADTTDKYAVIDPDNYKGEASIMVGFIPDQVIEGVSEGFAVPCIVEITPCPHNPEYIKTGSDEQGEYLFCEHCGIRIKAYVTEPDGKETYFSYMPLALEYVKGKTSTLRIFTWISCGDDSPAAITVEKDTNLTIDGGGIDYSGTGADPAAILVDGGTLTLKGGSSSDGFPDIRISCFALGDKHINAIRVKSGTLNIEGDLSINGYCKNMLLVEGGTVNINDISLKTSQMTPETTGINITGGEVNINKGKIALEIVDYPDNFIPFSTAIEISGGKLNIEDGDIAGNTSLLVKGGETYISGGVFSGNNYGLRYASETGDTKVELSGGLFTGHENNAILIDGKACNLAKLLAENYVYYYVPSDGTDAGWKYGEALTGSSFPAQTDVEVLKAPVVINQQPEDITRIYGEPTEITLDVTINTKETETNTEETEVNTETIVDYQWYWIDSDGEHKIDGADTNTLTLTDDIFTPVNSPLRVQCRITADGYKVETNIVKVTTQKGIQEPLTIKQPEKVVYGDTFILTANGGSGNGEITWNVEGNAEVVNSTGSEITITATGTGEITVTATKAGDEYYNSVTSETLSITPERRPVNITDAEIAEKTYDGNKTATVTNVTFGGLVEVDHEITSEDYTAVATFDSAVAGPGKTVTVTVKPVESANIWKLYSLENAEFILKGQTIEKATPTLNVPDGITKTYGDSSFTLDCSTNEDGDGKITYETSNSNVADVSEDGKVTIKNAGEAVITVTLAEGTCYTGTEKTVNIKVNKAPNAPNPPESPITVPYEIKELSEIPLPENWQWKAPDTDLPIDAPTQYIVVYVGEDKGNYENLEAEVTVTRTSCTHGTTEIRGKTEPKCTKEGYTGDKYCTDCGALLEKGKAIEANGHTGGTATCCEKAVCEVCKTAYGELDPDNHTGGTELQGKKSVTCTENGYTGDTVCKGCEAVLEKGTVIKATGHTGGTATCCEKAVCEVCKTAYGELDPDNHTGGTELQDKKSATCTENGYTGDEVCKGCGKVIKTGKAIPALGHDYHPEVTKEPTVDEEGERTYTCSRCGDKYTESIPKLPEPEHQHSYTEKVTKEATCTEAGVITYTCSCGDSYTKPIPALGHDYHSEVTREANCTEDGVITYTCSRCKGSYTESTPALGHNYKSEVTKEPTVDEEGIRTYTCTRCGDSYNESIPKLPEPEHQHSYTRTVTKEANCTEAGVITYTCSCGDSYTETIPALGHNYKSEVIKEPTVDEEGIRTYTCTRCGDSYNESIPKLPEPEHQHSYTKTVTKEANCTEAGIITYTCSCGDSYTETIPALGHDYHSEVTKEPTVEEEGIRTYTCTRCNDSYNENIPRLPESTTPESTQPPVIVNPEPVQPADTTTQPEQPVDTTTQLPHQPEVTCIKGEDGKEGWEIIQDEAEETPEGEIIVEMNGAVVVPGYIFDTIKGKDVTITFDMGNGISWSVNGMSVADENIADIDFTVNMGVSEIPVGVINNVTGDKYSMQLSLAYDGEFGFTAVLSVGLGEENKGYYASLYYYDEAINDMEFICESLIGEDGGANLKFTHASDYLIVIDEKSRYDGEGPAPEGTTGAGDEGTSAGDNPSTGVAGTDAMGALLLITSVGVVFALRKKREKH